MTEQPTPTFEQVAIPATTRAGRPAAPNPYTEAVANLAPNSGALLVKNIPTDKTGSHVTRLRQAGKAAGVTVRTSVETDAKNDKISSIVFWTVPLVKSKKRAASETAAPAADAPAAAKK